MNEQEFPQGSVPVAVAARVYGKDASWVRAGIISGRIRSPRRDPKRLYEETGFLWKGERQ